MTISETAKRLGLKVRTIREWIKVGAIRAEKIGKYWYIPEKELERAEVIERADKGREHSKRIKRGIELGVLARGSQNPEKSV